MTPGEPHFLEFMGRKSNFLVLALLVPAIWFLGTSYEAATDESALAALTRATPRGWSSPVRLCC